MKINQQFEHDIDADIVYIRLSENTMQNCFDVVIENEDYTLENIRVWNLYQIF